MTELKPCPFCDAELIPYLKEEAMLHPSNDCAIHGWLFSISSLSEKWNTRPEEDRLNARIKELEAELAVLKEANRWISVEEGLPDELTLCFVVGNNTIVVPGYVNDLTWRNADGRAIPFIVTHYRPLPQPPELKL